MFIETTAKTATSSVGATSASGTFRSYGACLQHHHPYKHFTPTELKNLFTNEVQLVRYVIYF